MKKINVLVCTDDNYVPQCGIMLTSLFVNNKSNNLQIFVLSEEINENNKRLLCNTANNYGVEMHFVSIDKDMLQGFNNTIKLGDHVSLAAYYRLFCSNILPQDIDKVLYLDCDIIINRDIADLYNYNIDNYALAGVIDENYFCSEYYDRLDLDRNVITYINSGVLLINLNYWRKYNVTSRCVECVHSIPQKLLFHDQDTLNVVLKNEINYLPITWNFQTAFLYCINQEKYEENILKEINSIINNPSIIHYTGTSKPWFSSCYHPYKNYYLYYKAMSEWRDWKLIRSESSVSKIKRAFYNIFCYLGILKKKETYIIKPIMKG